ncbi:hypothetical protein EGW08_003919 [Elysia chlorotica]|uniref:SEA domain-containing protein n=1 Tax=Elysia chlorotica TaxID=188477 RepID=A0A3S1A1P2_ELYCH|nr:hypothetical protein EGW08_003919 [Elysia chlorotica]
MNQEHVGARNSSRTLAVDASLRILNETFTPGMVNTSSVDFLRIAGPVCEEVDSFFMGSNYSGSYMGCKVNVISQGNLLVDFTLTFNGSHGLDPDSLRWHIYDIIDAGTTKHFLGQPGQQLVYVLLRHFLVDIRTNWGDNFDGVEAILTIPVFNLNYTYTLESRNSPDFRRIAIPFCADVRRILTNELHSPFADRYYSCYVADFSPGPDRVTFHVHFVGREWRQLQKELVHVIIDGATEATIQTQTVKLIGPLIVTPYKIDFTIRPINVTRTTPITPTTVTTTTASTIPDLTYIYVVFETWNLTLTSALLNQNSNEFKILTAEFCHYLERLFDNSIYGYRFYNCRVLAFRRNPTSIVVSVGYVGGPWAGMGTSVEYVIRRHAPGYYYERKELYLVGDDPVRIHFYLVFYGTDLGDGVVTSVPKVIRRFGTPVYYLVYLTYRVGELLVLPEKRPGVDPDPSVYPTNITVLPSTLAPTSTWMYSTTVDSTSISPSSSYDITPNGILLYLYYEVYNLTYTTALMYPTSPEFIRHRDAVCDDLWRWYMASDSPFIGIYRACDVTSFRRDPVGVTFTLLFETRMHDTFITEIHNHSLLYNGDSYDPSHSDLDLDNGGHVQQYDLDIHNHVNPKHHYHCTSNLQQRCGLYIVIQVRFG